LLVDELLHLVRVFDFAEFCADRLKPFEQSSGFGKTCEHVLFDSQFGIEFRLLRQITHRCALGGPSFAPEVFVNPRHNLHKRGFAGAIGAQHADLGVGIEREPDVLQDRLPAGKRLGHAVHDVDVLISSHAPLHSTAGQESQKTSC